MSSACFLRKDYGINIESTTTFYLSLGRHYFRHWRLLAFFPHANQNQSDLLGLECEIGFSACLSRCSKIAYHSEPNNKMASSRQTKAIFRNTLNAKGRQS